MRAVIHTTYGPPDVLELADVAKPPRYTKKDVFFLKALIEAGHYQAVIPGTPGTADRPARSAGGPDRV